MGTTRHAFAGPGELEAALALVCACRTAEHATPWPPLSELRSTLTALPSGTAHAQLWEDAQGTLIAVALLWDESVLVSAVHPDVCTEPLELELLRWGWSTATNEAHRRGERACLFVPVSSQDHGRIALLEREGFVADEWRTLQMSRPLGLPIAEPLVPDGFIVRPAGPKDTAAALLTLHNEIFVGLPKTRSERRALRQASTYRPALDLVAVAPDRRLAAYCFGSVSPDDGRGPSAPAGWIERIGVRADFRRRGLGRAILLQALRTMRTEGLDCALLTTGASNTAARRLFAECGFHTTCEIGWYVRGQEG